MSHQAADSFCLPSEYSPTGINFQEGGYSFVFFTGTVATKIFRCDNALEPFIKRTFNSEVEAYIKVQNYPELRKITPKFLGPIKFNTLIDNNEKYPSKQILMPAYAYQMEYVSVPFIKLIQHPQCDAITKQFLDAGICHLKDASVTDPSPIGGNNEIGVRVIDFSIEEHILQQEDLVRTDL